VTTVLQGMGMQPGTPKRTAREAKDRYLPRRRKDTMRLPPTAQARSTAAAAMRELHVGQPDINMVYTPDNEPPQGARNAANQGAAGKTARSVFEIDGSCAGMKLVRAGVPADAGSTGQDGRFPSASEAIAKPRPRREQAVRPPTACVFYDNRDAMVEYRLYPRRHGGFFFSFGVETPGRASAGWGKLASSVCSPKIAGAGRAREAPAGRT